MPIVSIMEFHENIRFFKHMRDMELAGIPTMGDLVVIDTDGEPHIFEVYDVHYAENAKVNVNVIHLSTLKEHNSSGFEDIE
ncbi:MAG: hypothetical protein WCG87_10275 [Bacteroidota bacterium]